ncbi:CapA family protein [Hymenobacter sp. BT664]|uniref:CapA family protein n=1 Tax=Hymenobacter montanus TaxID=2771359 RepID=A0A927BG04_9BACT|nr:CapA family protein [Hymenobacter montanus]MBD2770195.1 CapA family protein [Hymenobacter montanus]
MHLRISILAGLLVGTTLAACQPELPLRVSVVGDVLLARSVPTALARDSSALAHRARTWWADSRYVIGNLECPLTTTHQPVAKPFVFRGAPSWAGWLRRLGFTHVSLANNHTLDQHLTGLRDTYQAVRATNVGALGYQPDSTAGCLPTLLGADSSVAVLAYSAFRGTMAGESCVCGGHFRALCERLATYKTLFPKRAVLVYLHWGTEYAGLPTREQRQQARTLIDCGAAAVVGAHPHVVQTVEYYRGRPILYSLGNFLFDQQGSATDLAVQADFDLRDGRVVGTFIRPLQLVGAVPQTANAPAQAGLAARIRRYSPAVRLVPDGTGSGWRLQPVGAGAEFDSVAGFFERRVAVAGPAGPTTARLRYLPYARQSQVWVPTANGGYSTLTFRFPVYAFGTGDVDNDGYADVLIGPIKPTRFDGARHRRLFVYFLDSTGQLQPRWRGSRLSYRLLYFKTVRTPPGPTYVRTLEQAPNGRYCVGRYHWQGFGLTLDGFLAPRQSLDAAYRDFVL